MRNLIAFYLRFRVFLVFAMLQGVALYFYFSSAEFARIQFLTTTSKVNGEIMEVRNDITKHFGLEQENRKLQLENRMLREHLRNSLYRYENGVIRVDDTVYKQQYEYIPAKVIGSTFDKRDNYMTIELGRRSGIKTNMGVFSSNGVVGIVYLVGENFSLVKTVLTKNINVDVMLEKGGAFGLLKWDGNDPRIVNVSGISNDMTIKKWAKVVTRGESGIFPRGITVGRVVKKGFIEGEPLWDIKLKLAEDLRKIQHVYVVKNLMLEELQELQSKIPVPKEEEEL